MKCGCRALVGPWKSLNFFSRISRLGNRHGHWKFLNLCLKVLESAWIWFSKTLWPNKSMRSNWIQWQLLMHLVHFSDNSSFWLMLEGVKLLNVNWTYLYMLIKVPVWFNSVLLYNLRIVFESPWKVLEFHFDKWARNMGWNKCILNIWWMFW